MAGKSNRAQRAADMSFGESLKLNCLSFCDQSVAELENVDCLPAEDKPRRIYIGSYFCQNFFQYQLRNLERYLSYADKLGAAITIVVPPLFQDQFNEICSGIEKALIQAASIIDEICLNDYGSLLRFGDCGLVLSAGRLLYRQSRDPRFSDYFEDSVTPSWALEIVTDFFKALNVSIFEVDPTHKNVVLAELPRGLTYAVHWPLCYQSVGSICVFANSSNSLFSNYTPNIACCNECLTGSIRHKTDAGIEYVRQGRAILFENRECKVEPAHRYRQIVPAAYYKEIAG